MILSLIHWFSILCGCGTHRQQSRSHTVIILEVSRKISTFAELVLKIPEIGDVKIVSNLCLSQEKEKANGGYKHNKYVSRGILNLTFPMLQHTSSEVTVTKYANIYRLKLKRGIGN